MPGRKLINGFDKGRLRVLLALVFVALAVPTAILIWQAYGQLKWEAFHQHRGVAEELSRRIDTRLNDMIRAADARSFADYTFLVVSGDPSANFVQRSPLSAYPVIQDLPGALGYFQVDTEGAFSTPLLPPAGTSAADFGIDGGEYESRQRLAQEIQAILADNRLVQSRQLADVRRRLAAPVAGSETTPEEDKEVDEDAAAAAGGFMDEMSSVSTAAERVGARPSEKIGSSDESYSQEVFDELYQRRQNARDYAPAAGTVSAVGEVALEEQRLDRVGKVSDLKLDDDLQSKSEQAERESPEGRLSVDSFASGPSRAKRREQIALPETIRLSENEPVANVKGATDLRINTFESEIDPFEFSLLDSGHFVLFRRVWRDGERFIQGLLVDQASFVRDVVGAQFEETALSSMSSLIVAWNDDVLFTFSGGERDVYPDVAEDLDGELLYRNRLTAPLNSLELIFSIKHLPPGAGASVLGWVTLVLAGVFVGGFVTLYRLGLRQIDLSRQQQDFVSAVSHELKSPLTSIRMYGEMLKEGWADEEKRQSYYEFIHDESERLSRLIANVLQLARITRNEPQFDLKPATVADLMRNTMSKISNQVERAGFELIVNSTGVADAALIEIDEDCFAQIIINLVDNAIKFSRQAESKVIEISSNRCTDGRIQFSVRDYGPGIPKDQMKKIFELFYRSESELTRETVGTGIGLAIVHQLALAMNGSVDLVNAEPGAEFRITFPAGE